MLKAEGEIVAAAQRRTARTTLKGPYYEGAVAEAVTVGKPHETKKGRALSITFEGEQHKERLSKIASINEHGKTNQPARPFIATANAESEAEAQAAAQAIYDAYLTSKGV